MTSRYFPIFWSFFRICLITVEKQINLLIVRCPIATLLPDVQTAVPLPQCSPSEYILYLMSWPSLPPPERQMLVVHYVKVSHIICWIFNIFRIIFYSYLFRNIDFSKNTLQNVWSRTSKKLFRKQMTSPW